MRKSFVRRFIAMLVSTAMMVCAEGGSFPFVNNYSAIEYLSAEDSITLSAPTNVRWKEGSSATAQWDAVAGANYYEIEVKVYKNEILIGTAITGTNESELDLQQEIHDITKNCSENSVSVTFSVTSMFIKADKEKIYGNVSVISSKYAYFLNTEKLEKTQNLQLDDTCILSWKTDEKVNDYYYYYINFYKNEDCSEYAGMTYGVIDDWDIIGGKSLYDFSKEIDNSFVRLGLLGEEITVFIEIKPFAKVLSNGEYITLEGEFVRSNTILYSGLIIVDTISLSPKYPILYKENSIHLGKTIIPEDTYYSYIDWSSSDTSIVSVDIMGKITANAIGTAEITAAIGTATDTVTVTVYEIDSNIDDEIERDGVSDTAGGIIDDIVNNNSPDLGNTDIPEDKVEDIKQEIQDAVENGNTFHTDIKAIQETFDTYKNNWGQVQQAAKDLNAQFAGAYNIEVEMYHKDKNDEEHHIGNITEFENEITFTFDLPTGNTDKNKRYVLVRIHTNSDGTTEYTPLDVTINGDGTFTAKSNKFSDFVLLTSDYDCNSNNHNYNSFGYCRDCGSIKNGTDAFVSTNAVVGGRIGMNFKVALSEEAAADSEARMEFTSESGKVISIPISEALLIDPSKGIYQFTVTMTSTQMNEKITAQMYFSDVISYNNGTSKSILYDYSINQYLDNIRNEEELKSNSNQKIIRLIDSMKNYGCYLDEYTNDLSNPGDSSILMVPEIDNSYNTYRKGTVDGIKSVSAYLSIGPLLDVCVKYEVNKGSIFDYRFYVDDQIVTPKHFKDNIYIVSKQALTPSEYNSEISFLVEKGVDTELLKYSPYTYIKNKLADESTSGKLKNVCKAIYTYAESMDYYILPSIGTEMTIGNYNGSDSNTWKVVFVNKKQNQVTLLSNNLIGGNRQFNSSAVKGNIWKCSDIREYINSSYFQTYYGITSENIVLTGARALVETHNITYKQNSDYIVCETYDKVFLLSVEEAKEISRSEELKSILPKGNGKNIHGWWLRSPGSDFNYSGTTVNYEGHITNGGAYVYNGDVFGLRPAISLQY